MEANEEHTASVSLFSDYPSIRAVPDFVGLNYEQARPLERNARVHIADTNPDAPPISNFWWEHKEFVVTRQTPDPGTRIDITDSVTVTLAPPEEPVGASVRRIDPPVLSAIVDSNEPQTEDHDLGD